MIPYYQQSWTNSGYLWHDPLYFLKLHMDLAIVSLPHIILLFHKRFYHPLPCRYSNTPLLMYTYLRLFHQIHIPEAPDQLLWIFLLMFTFHIALLHLYHLSFLANFLLLRCTSNVCFFSVHETWMFSLL